MVVVVVEVVGATEGTALVGSTVTGALEGTALVGGNVVVVLNTKQLQHLSIQYAKNVILKYLLFYSPIFSAEKKD